jgi:hypothetical protein
MTLRGSLRDFSLAEVLHMASLSRKAGVLSLRGETGTTWIGLEAGAVVRVARDDGTLTPEKLRAEAGGGDTADVAETLRRATLDVLVALFEWSDGEFDLDSTVDPRQAWPGPEGVGLEPPVDIQSLTLELTRREEHAPEASAEAPAKARRQRSCALIAVGPDLARLEQLKAAAATHVERVHLFQLPPLAVKRVGAYLADGRFPLVLLDVGASGWPADAEWTAVAERLRGLAVNLRVVGLGEQEPGAWLDEVLPWPPDEATLAELLGPVD